MIDFDKLNEYFEGDEDILKTFMEQYIETYPENIKAIESALENQDNRQLYEAAHEFKGVVSNLFCEEAVSKALELEQNGRTEENFDSNKELFEQLKQAAKSIEDELKNYLKSL